MDFILILLGFILGTIAWFVANYVLAGFYTIQQNERAVKTIFGKAERIGSQTTLSDPVSEGMRDTERDRYEYPQVRIIGPGVHFKFPWEKVYKVSVATETVNVAFDPETPRANHNNTKLDAVTKDQLDTGLTGQIRFTVCERNLYAYLFAIKNPVAHVMGFFISILRERIANYEAPALAEGKSAEEVNMTDASDLAAVSGISINDLRKNLRDINQYMERECHSSAARYGIALDAALITGIDPPPAVDSALAAINTAHNHVSAELSMAQAAADQRIVESKRAVEIETLNAQAEVEPLNWLATQLSELKKSGPDALPAYIRNIRLALYGQARRIIMEMKK